MSWQAIDLLAQANPKFGMARPPTDLRKKGASMFAGLLLLSMGAALPCSSMCRLCTAYAAECEQVSSLTDVLVGLSSFTETIILQNGNLSVIPPKSFTNFSNLHFLTITGFLVLSLTDLTFSTTQVNSLRILDLSSNRLFSCLIEPMAFSGLLFLEELILTNNSLDLLRSSWFSEMPVLKKLFLGVNQIGYLPPRAFDKLANLDELVVRSNLIQYLPMDTFYGLSSLTRLDLSDNKILFINHEVFQPLPALEDLLLFHNLLTVLPAIPDSVTSLFLHGNPWECNCQLADSMEPLLAKIQSSAGVLCNSPPSVAGGQVVDIRLEYCPPASSSPLPPSSSAAHPPPLNVLDRSLIYGLLGGVLLSALPALLCCCCFLRYGCCTRCRNQAEGKPNKLLRLFSSGRRDAQAEPQGCWRPPVEGTLPAGSELGDTARGTCRGCPSRASSACDAGQRRPVVQSSPEARFPTDVPGRTVAPLQERGRGAACPAPGQPCRHAQGCVSRACEGSNSCGSREQRCAQADHGCLPQRAARQEERMERGGQQDVDTQMDKQPLGPDKQAGDIQNSPTLVHIDFPDGTALEIKGERSSVYGISPKREDSHQGGLVVQRGTLSPGRIGHYHRPGLMSPGVIKASEARKSFMERRRPMHTTRHRKPSWKTDLYPKYYSMLAGQTKNTQPWNRLCDQGPTSEVPPSSSNSSSPIEVKDLSPPKKPYVDMLPIPRQSGRRKCSSQQLDEAPVMGRTAREHGVAQSSRRCPDIPLTSNTPTIESVWQCPRCGCKTSNSYLITQRVLAQQNPPPKTSGKQLEAATQCPSSDTVLHKECNIALTVLGFHHNTKKSLLEELRPSGRWSNFQSSFAVSQPEQSEDVDSAYEYPSPPVAATLVGHVFPLTNTQWIRRDRDQRVGVMETLESETVVDDSVDNYPPNTFSEEMLNAEASSKGLANDQQFVEDEKDAVNSPPKVTHLAACYDVSNSLLFQKDTNASLLKSLLSDGSCSEVSYSGDVEDAYDDVATITSRYPVIEKMCQIEFPFLGEEEKLSRWKENGEGKNGPAQLTQKNGGWWNHRRPTETTWEKVT